MANFYSNENFPYPTVTELRRLGHDVLTAAEADNANKFIPDERVAEFAHQNGRILLTFNRKDFLKIHRQLTESGQTHSGIFICTLDLDFKRLAENIHAAALASESFESLLVRVTKSNPPQ